MAFFGSADRINVIAEIRAKVGSETVVRAALVALVAPTRKEDGCKEYRLHVDKTDPHSFYTYEEWSSEASLQEHLRGVQPALEQLKPLLNGEVKISVLIQAV